MKKNIALLVGIHMVLNVSSPAFAVEKISTIETISAQSVRGDDVISPYHVTGESLVGLIQKMGEFDIPGSNIIFNRRTAQLFVRNTPTNHELIEGILGNLRKAQSRQVEIEARIIKVSSTDIDDLGLDFLDIDANGKMNEITFGTDSNYNTNIDFPNVVGGTEVNGGQLSFATTGSRFDVDAYIDALKSRAVVNTLSAPRLIVANNQRANITKLN